MKYFFSITFTILLALNLSGQKVVLMEKFTNSHCGVCPVGALELADIVDEYDHVIWVSHYKPWGNILNNAESTQLWSDFGSYGNPLLVVDRTHSGSSLFHGMSSWFGVVDQALEAEQVARVDITDLNTNAFTRTIDFKCEVGFLSDQESAEYRITAMIVEDLVTGEPQDNHFSDTPGHPLYGLGHMIWNYEHRNVVRHIFDDAWGTANLLPAVPQAGDLASQHYQYQIPAGYDIDNMSIVCSITKYNPSDLSQIEALQAAELHLVDGFITSTKEIDQAFQYELFPNPASSFFDLKLSEHADEVKIINAIGQTVYHEQDLPLNPRIDLSNFEAGTYVVQVNINAEWVSKMLSVVVAR